MAAAVAFCRSRGAQRSALADGTRTQITIAEDDDHAFFLAVAHLLSFIFF